MQYEIRKMKRDDCKGVARVVTLSWNQTYKGIVNDDILNNMYNTEEQRATNSYNNFNEEDNHQLVLIVNDDIVGFVNVGVIDEAEFSGYGELFAIYILKEYHGYGFGKKLFLAGAEEMKNLGFNKFIVGCLSENPSNDFYKHMGGKLVKQRIFEKLQLPENVYYFENLK